MEASKDQIEIRRGKLERLRQAGFQAYPNDFTPKHLSAELRATYGDTPDEELSKVQTSFSLAGRVLAIRLFGKAAFIQLEDGSGRLQVYVRRDIVGNEGYEWFRSIDVGDIVGAVGRVFRTRTGELTLEAAELRLLSKCLHPLPEKWHGLTDVELRYRQRYLDLMVNPEVREVFRRRSQIIGLIRKFFERRGFLEVETPMMHAIPGGAAARPFVTHHNALNTDLYLRVAPELFLKRLLVGGFERVFELNRSFRNEGLSVRHNPEFTMLEFYQAFATYEDLMTLTEELFVEVAQETCGAEVFRYAGHEIDLKRPWRKMSLTEAIAAYGGVAEHELTNIEGLGRVGQAKGLRVDPALSYGELLVELFENLVEPELIQPTFIVGYPLEVSPLARKKDSNPSLVDRFELFIGGRELANAFSELNDPVDQNERFLAQAEARRQGDETAGLGLVDEDYVRALEYGMPPAAGEGIGIDRMVMLFTDSASIRDVILFPLLRAQQ